MTPTAQGRVRARDLYRFGDATLAIDTDDDALLAMMRELYAECAVSPGTPGLAVRCKVRSLRGGLVFVGVRGATVDVAGIVRSLLEPRPDDYVRERASERPGWRSLARIEAPAATLIDLRAQTCVLRPALLPPFFLRDLVLATALRPQNSVLFMHAASVVVHGAGVLLAGRAGAGKTTLSLALAGRGHALLGDDFAALRRDSLELLPFRRTLHIRPGLRAACVDDALAAASAAGSPSRWSALPGDLFPGSDSAPTRLQAAFFLRSFRRQAAVEPFTPSLRGLEALRSLPIRHQWGIARGGRLMRFLLAIRLLSQVRCYHLDVGRPEATAALVETTVHTP